MAGASDEQRADYLRAKYTAALFHALASPTRVRLIEVLADGGTRTIPELVGLVGPGLITAGNVSSHLAVLYRAGVVDWRREGNRSYYKLRHPDVARLCRLAAPLNPTPRA